MEQIVVVKDVIGTPDAILTCFGEEVANEIIKHLKNGDTVIVDFEGTKNVNINFTQFMINPVYRKFPKKGRSDVEFINLPGEFAEYELNEAKSLANDKVKAERIARIRHEAFMTPNSMFSI